MSKFDDYTKLKWEKLNDSDKKFATMNSLNAASSVMQGSKISSGDFIQYAEEILMHFYEFSQFQKPLLNKETSILQTNPPKQELNEKKVPF